MYTWKMFTTSNFCRTSGSSDWCEKRLKLVISFILELFAYLVTIQFNIIKHYQTIFLFRCCQGFNLTRKTIKTQSYAVNAIVGAVICTSSFNFCYPWNDIIVAALTSFHFNVFLKKPVPSAVYNQKVSSYSLVLWQSISLYPKINKNF